MLFTDLIATIGLFWTQLSDTFTAIQKFLIPLLVLFGLGGCVDPNASPADQEAQFNRGIAMVEKVADLADRSGFVWKADISVHGRPAVGQELRFFLDTGVQIDIAMHGNSSAGRLPDPTVTGTDG